jgi:hypothetical protein
MNPPTAIALFVANVVATLTSAHGPMKNTGCLIKHRKTTATSKIRPCNKGGV